MKNKPTKKPVKKKQPNGLEFYYLNFIENPNKIEEYRWRIHTRGA